MNDDSNTMVDCVASPSRSGGVLFIPSGEYDFVAPGVIKRRSRLPWRRKTINVGVADFVTGAGIRRTVIHS